MAKGRKPIIIDRLDLLADLERAEANGPLANRGILYQVVADIWNANPNRKPRLLSSTVRNLMIKLDIDCKTPLGKKGGEGGDFGRSKGVKPQPYKNRHAKQVNPEILQQMIDEVPSYGDKDWSQRNAEKILAGSNKAKMHRKCMQCANFQREEVRHCGVVTCGLYTIRPFKTREEKAELIEA